MTDLQKRTSLISLLLLATAIVLVAGALPGMELKPGTPLPWVISESWTSASESSSGVIISLNTFFAAVFGAVMLIILGYAAYNMLRGVKLKEIIKPALILAAVTLGIVCILFLMVNVHITTSPQVKEVLPPTLEVQGPPLGPMPPGLIWLVLTGMAVAVMLLGIWLIRWRSQRRLLTDPLQKEAELAVRSLRNGLDFKSVILRCYRQMSLALQKEQGIELEMNMTAREFERLLEIRGVPPVPVHQLTRLFESVRYGVHPPTPADEQMAVECLNAIVQFSRLRTRQDRDGAG